MLLIPRRSGLPERRSLLMRKLAIALLLLAACRHDEPPAAAPALPVPKCRDLCGVVRDAAGRPVPRFSVYLFDPGHRINVGLPPGYPQMPGAQMRSFEVDDPGGTFDAGRVDVPSVVVGISAPGFLVQETRVDVPASAPLIVELQPAWKIRGTITDEGGVPVDGARILSGDRVEAEAKDGRYEIEVQKLPPSRTYTATAPGFLPAQFTVEIRQPVTTRDVQLARATPAPADTPSSAAPPPRRAVSRNSRERR